MISFNVEFEELEGLLAAFNSAPELVDEELYAAGEEGLSYLAEDTTQEPARPGRPIHWDSPRQKRAFFATDGFGRGIPTQRTGNLVAQQENNVVTNAGLLTAIRSLNAPEAKWVRDARAQSAIFESVYKTVQQILAERQQQIIERLREVPNRVFARLFSRGSIGE